MGFAAAANALEEQRSTIASALADRHFAAHPELRERYGAIGYEKCLEDANYHLRYLEQSLRLGDSSLFAEYATWARVMLEARRIPREDLIRNLDLLASVIRDRAGGEIADVTSPVIAGAIAALNEAAPAASFVSPDNPHAELATAYLQALLRGDRWAATKLIRNAYAAGTATLRDIYINVFQQTQYEIGRLWQTNAITVADEHFCTAATQAIMSQFYPDLFALPKNGRRLVMASIGGELHEIGARMVADIFELEGWTAYYYGANTPTSSLVAAICDRQPDVVGVSVTMLYHIPALTHFIAQMRESPGCSSARVIVGGYPFRQSPRLWQQVGADGSAADAIAAVELARKLVES